jgi:cephalosporin hydroxylase
VGVAGVDLGNEVSAIIEVGVRHGGTTLWLADTLRSFRGDNAVVVGIDIEQPPMLWPDNVRFIHGDSIAPETVAAAASHCADRKTMVMVDGNHAAAHVLQELRLNTPLVSDGCYFVAEDGIVDVMEWTHVTPGPLVTVQQLLAEDDEFAIDRSREKFLLTYAPDGFLKRVRPSRAQQTS